MYRRAQNFGGFETARKLAEKILMADHINNSSLLERATFGGLLIVRIIRQSFIPPKFCAVRYDVCTCLWHSVPHVHVVTVTLVT